MPASGQPSGRVPHIDDDLCTDLLLGLLSSAERREVVSHLRECPACERLLQERAAEVERLAATKVLRQSPAGELVLEKRGSAARAPAGPGAGETDQLGGLLADRGRAVLKAFRRPRWELAWGLAAAAAVVFLLLGPLRERAPEGPHPYLLRSYSFQLQVRESDESPGRQDLKAGLEAYDRRDFEGAIALLEKAKESGLSEVDEIVRSIYLGSALAWRGRYEEGVKVLEKVSLLPVPGEWGREARWTLYVCLRESGQRARADSLLQALAGIPGEVGDRARKVLNR